MNAPESHRNQLLSFTTASFPVSIQSNGVRLGWLIDPFQKKVHIYRSDSSIEILDAPMTLSDENVLPGFVFDLSTIWE